MFIQILGDDGALGAGVEVELGIFHNQVLTRDGVALGDVCKDERGILDHGYDCMCVCFGL